MEVSGKVLLRNFREKGGTGKLKRHWEDEIYIVVERYPNLSIYSIKPF